MLKPKIVPQHLLKMRKSMVLSTLKKQETGFYNSMTGKLRGNDPETPA